MLAAVAEEVDLQDTQVETAVVVMDHQEIQD
jgi:hypothetical protein